MSEGRLHWLYTYNIYTYGEVPYTYHLRLRGTQQHRAPTHRIMPVVQNVSAVMVMDFTAKSNKDPLTHTIQHTYVLINGKAGSLPVVPFCLISSQVLKLFGLRTATNNKNRQRI